MTETGLPGFVALNTTVEHFIQEQENNNTSSKTKRDVALMDIFLLSQSNVREMKKNGTKASWTNVSNFPLEVRKQSSV